MTGGGVVDASGVLSSILSSYRTVAVEYQRQVTGDPDALTKAAQNRSGQAKTVSGGSRDIIDAATKLHADWDGDAYAAYAAASGKIGTELSGVGVKLDAQAMALTGAATALRTAKATVDAVLAQFDQRANQLITLARTASSTAVNDFVNAARQLGESLVDAAKAAADQLGATLAQLFPGESTTEIGRLEHDLGKYAGGALHWLNGEPLDGRGRPRSAPSWFGNSGWKKLTTDGLRGTRAPLAANTPFGRPEPETLGQKAWGNTEITYAKWKGEQDGLTPGWDLKVASQGWDAKVAGHAQLAALDKSIDGKVDYGVAEASGKASVFVGADANLALQAGAHGVGAHVNAFVGGKVEGEVAADVAGVGVGANGTLQYGLGAQLDGQAVYDAGHIKVNFKAGAAVGLGFGVGAKIDVDLPKMYHTAEQYGGAVVDGVSHAANEAADAVGSMWTGAVSSVESH
jgi:uncharacterized protein YukE